MGISIRPTEVDNLKHTPLYSIQTKLKIAVLQYHKTHNTVPTI